MAALADDELALRKQTERAAHAEALAKDELLNEAFASLEADLLSLWRGTKAHETAVRENVWTAVTILGKVRRHLETVIADGAVAASLLKSIAGR